MKPAAGHTSGTVARTAHTDRMVAAIVPMWAAPTDAQLEDAHRIAHAAAADGGGLRWQAHAAALDWVTRLQDAAPVTGRADRPTEAVVRAEMLTADCVVSRTVMAPEMWDNLAVPPAAPITNNREWCDGVAAVLGWLLGSRPPPIRVPRRNRDGSVMTADQLYAEKKAARRILPPEDRARLRTQAEVEAEVYRRLAALAAHRVVTATPQASG